MYFSRSRSFFPPVHPPIPSSAVVPASPGATHPAPPNPQGKCPNEQRVDRYLPLAYLIVLLVWGTLGYYAVYEGILCAKDPYTTRTQDDLFADFSAEELRGGIKISAWSNNSAQVVTWFLSNLGFADHSEECHGQLGELNGTSTDALEISQKMVKHCLSNGLLVYTNATRPVQLHIETYKSFCNPY